MQFNWRRQFLRRKKLSDLALPDTSFPGPGVIGWFVPVGRDKRNPVLRSFETSFKPLAFSHCGSHRPLHRRERSRLSSAPCFLQRWSGMKYPACGDRDWSASLSSLRRPRQVAPFCAPAPILEPAFESAFRRSALPPLFAEAGIRHRRPISAPGRDPNPSVQNRCFARIVCEEIFECSWRTHSNLNVRDPIRRDKRKGGDREEIGEGNG